MRLISVLVAPDVIPALRRALEQRHNLRVYMSEALETELDPSRREFYRGESYSVDLVPRVRLDIPVWEADCDAVVELIASVTEAEGADSGAGYIWVTQLHSVTRIRPPQPSEPVRTSRHRHSSTRRGT
jgi:nitrogen regulatory protein P-II 1